MTAVVQERYGGPEALEPRTVAAAALTYLATEHARAKVVLTVP